MRKTELKNCPQWLLDADTYQEDIEWRHGDWIWRNGTWRNGTWKNGTWRNGTWKGGTWEFGFWEGGTWQYGFWKNGTWKNGVWKNGVWKDGIWKNGTWKNGTWQYGIWKGGIFEGGYEATSRCKWAVTYKVNEEIVRIGCKEKSINEWDAFFDSDEEYETERGTEAFTSIRKAYLQARYAIQLHRESN